MFKNLRITCKAVVDAVVWFTFPQFWIVVGTASLFFMGDVELPGQSFSVGADGRTYVQRRQDWLESLPAPNSAMTMEKRREYLFGWLEKGVYDTVVAEAIDHWLGDYWFKGIRAQHGYAVFMLLKYGNRGTKILSTAQQETIHSNYLELIEKSGAFGDLNPNKQIYAMVGVYLYTKYFDSTLSFPVYGHPVSVTSPIPDFYRNSWPDFRYNGRSYTFDSGPYDANQLSKDWIENTLDSWYVGKKSPRGNREFDSIDYHRAFPGAMALLWSLLDDGDPLKDKAKMAGDLMLLDAIMDIGNANAWGSTVGRGDYTFTARNPIFPTYIYWGAAEDVTRFDVKALYIVNYVPPPLLVDVGVLTDERDDYWHFHMENNGHQLLSDPRFGKWDFVTKNYNIGSNVGSRNSGWQVVVRGRKKESFIRFWINADPVAPPSTKETGYLGLRGRQYRNAIFADIGSQPYYWERKSDANWDLDETQGGWTFRKLGLTMVALKLGMVSAAVELATEGVDYATWSVFKNAIKSNALLADDYYRTSRGTKISSNDYCGLDSPGDCNFPFKRMETIDNQGNKIVSWNNNIMTVTRHGQTAIYDFNNWTFNENYQDAVPGPPAAPVGVTVKSSGSQ
ncbi:MAG: hypothetical protein ACE5HO_03835 [bacterium]